MNKRDVVHSCYRMGYGTPHFFDSSVVGIAFDSTKHPVLLVHKRGKVSKKLLEKCEGKHLRILKVPIVEGDDHVFQEPGYGVWC